MADIINVEDAKQYAAEKMQDIRNKLAELEEAVDEINDQISALQKRRQIYNDAIKDIERMMSDDDKRIS